MEAWHNALRPRGGSIQSRKILGTGNNIRRFQIINNEVPVGRNADCAKDPARDKSIDANTFGGVFARDPMRPIALIIGRKIAPDRQKT
jgi:hypothetical protein